MLEYQEFINKVIHNGKRRARAFGERATFAHRTSVRPCASLWRAHGLTTSCALRSPSIPKSGRARAFGERAA